MKIATYNVNGVNGRLPVLLRWLDEAAPDVVCLQELKAPEEKFPEKALKDAGYNAMWQGQKKLERGGHTCQGCGNTGSPKILTWKSRRPP